jgi:type IV secretory pathway VirB2 component (pilin)
MKYFLTFFSFFILLAPVFVFAQYLPLVGIPGVDNPQDFDEFLQSIYATAISLAALLAVIKIVIAGVKWMTTDIVSSKSDAKKDIQGAIFGLVVILGAVLILYIINPDIGTVDLTLEAPPRAAAPAGATLLLSEVKDCQDTPGTCKFETIPCGVQQTYSSNYKGPPPKKTYDCSLKEDTCLGDFVVAPGGEEAACLTTQEAAADKIAEVAAAYCPDGETCTAEICVNGRLLDCRSSCFDDGGTSFDEETNICVTSPSGTTALIENRIDTLLTGDSLDGKIVSNEATAAGFASTVGATQTLYLAELPGTPGPANAAANSSTLSAMREVCLEANKAQGTEGQTLNLKVDEYEGKYYVGCVQ